VFFGWTSAVLQTSKLQATLRTAYDQVVKIYGLTKWETHGQKLVMNYSAFGKSLCT
jgi:hypothetical protein